MEEQIISLLMLIVAGLLAYYAYRVKKEQRAQTTYKYQGKYYRIFSHAIIHNLETGEEVHAVIYEEDKGLIVDKLHVLPASEFYNNFSTLKELDEERRKEEE